MDGAKGRVGRREWLVGAAGLAIAGLDAGCGKSELGAGPSVVPASSAPSVDAKAAALFDVAEIGLEDLAAALASGRISSVALTEAYLDRIARLDRQGPALRSVLDINPDALEIARALDRERAAGSARGFLHGIPILVKENIASADKMETTAGSYALEGQRPRADAEVVARLRAAGAVLLGKTNLSEWANFRSTHASSGWSGRGGQTKNAYVLDRTPCGSSSGTGSAIAASFAAAGVGTETDGSIVCPSSMAALVGLKPTVGLVSRAGIIPLSPSQDTAGPMTRTVRDAAILLGVLASEDPRDPKTVLPKGSRIADFTTKLRTALSWKDVRLGVARAMFSNSSDVTAAFERTLAELSKRGAVIVDPVVVPGPSDLGDRELEVLLFEFKPALEAYLAELGSSARVHTLADLIAFDETDRAREMKFFGQELFVKAASKGPLTSEAYVRAKTEVQRIARTGIDGALAKHKLDALVAPTMGLPWLIDLVNGDPDVGGSSTLAAIAGYPHLTVPGGFHHELPFGFSFFSGAFTEPTLLALGHAFEQTFAVRRPPRFLTTAPL